MAYMFHYFWQQFMNCSFKFELKLVWYYILSVTDFVDQQYN